MGSPQPPEFQKNLLFLAVNTGSIIIDSPPEKFSADALV